MCVCSFAPPGMMSAGITCSLTVTFEPKVQSACIMDLHYIPLPMDGEC